MKQKTETKERNLLELIPSRLVQFKEDENGRMILLIPRFKKEWVKKLFLPKSKDPNIHISLDEFGSVVWNHCDGRKTVAQIAGFLQAQFGEKVDPVHERVAMFIQHLLRQRFISLEPTNKT